MKSLIIKTTKTNDGFKAWLMPDLKKSSTSPRSRHAAAFNLAVRTFLGHNRFAQLPDGEVEKVKVESQGGVFFVATYNGGGDSLYLAG